MAEPEFRNTILGWEVHESAREHGVSDAVTYTSRVVHLGEGPDGGPPRELRLGPDRAGNLSELIAVDLINGRSMVIHAMRMRTKYQHLLFGERG